MTAIERAARPLRADARTNRDKLLRAAAELFAAHGLEVSLNEVARAAGVGIATLQRNFASREDLVAAVFLERVIQYADVATETAAADDPWLGFRDFVERVCRMQQEDRGFAAVLTTDFPDVQELQAHRRRALREFTGLVERAKAAGALRKDFSPHDLPLILLANAGVVVGTGASAAKASRRVVAMLLRACAAGDDAPLPPAPPPRALLASLRHDRTTATGRR